MKKVLGIIGVIVLIIIGLLVAQYFNEKSKMLKTAQETGDKVEKVILNQGKWAKTYNIYLPKDMVSAENIKSIAADITFKEQKGITLDDVKFFDNEALAKTWDSSNSKVTKNDVIFELDHLICEYTTMDWKFMAVKNYRSLSGVKIK
jgi:beta-lactamase superfamily II metal-dependent hydrolase